MDAEEWLEPIADSEFVYRRILADIDHYSKAQGLSRLAFHPTQYDTDGISFTRSKFRTEVTQKATL